jgi:hypothetical protein
MILITHAVVGAACGALLGEGYSAVPAAFVSHFVLDAIPHWDYPLSSRMVAWDGAPAHTVSELIRSSGFWIDCLKIGADVVGGLGLVAYLTNGDALLLTCAAAAMFPDFLQFAHARFPESILSHLQRFHMWIHAQKRITNVIVGPALQIALIAVVIGAFFRN